MPLAQSTRIANLTSPLGEEVLALKSLTTQESISRLFQFEVEAVSERGDIFAKQLLGDAVCVELQCPALKGKDRYFHGYVSRFSPSPRERRYFHYHLTVVPWLWFLTRTSDCEIHQNLPVPQILEKVFKKHGFSDYEFRLRGRYEPWDYCVQYRETDFNFVSRLMEQEGIFYYFRHEAKRHVMVLGDSPGAFAPFQGYEKIAYRARTSGHPGEEHIREWLSEQRHHSGVYVHTDYDFERPKTTLVTKTQIPGESARANLEIFDYPGEYVQSPGGQDWARVRMEEMRMEYFSANGNGDSRGIVTGCTFQLADTPIPQEEGLYLFVSTSISLHADVYESNDTDSGNVFGCSFTAMKAADPFRPARITAKPIIQGVQTAVVTGPKGEEIYTDKYGRVTVQFHWDRYGKLNESSSCWVRVSQLWAGKNWGGMTIPRIGQEVVVSFLEGDPDQPIITGRVYNGECMPPYPLPTKKVISGVKTNSTPGGGGYNEMSMDDTKGKEKIVIHGQFDMETTVLHDQKETIGNNRTESVGVDHTETIGKNRAITIGANETITIGKDQSETIGKNRSETVGENETITVGKNYSLTVGDSISIKCGASSITMKKDGTILIEGKDISISGFGSIDVKSVKNMTLKGMQIAIN